MKRVRKVKCISAQHKLLFVFFQFCRILKSVPVKQKHKHPLKA